MKSRGDHFEPVVGFEAVSVEIFVSALDQVDVDEDNEENIHEHHLFFELFVFFLTVFLLSLDLKSKDPTAPRCLNTSQNRAESSTGGAMELESFSE